MGFLKCLVVDILGSRFGIREDGIQRGDSPQFWHFGLVKWYSHIASGAQ